MMNSCGRGNNPETVVVDPGSGARAVCRAIVVVAVFLGASGCSAATQGESIASSAQALSGDGLVISQVYGGGGNSGATLNQDFVEIFNASDGPVSLGGLSLQYGSATGSFAGGTQLTVLPIVDVLAGGYFLVGMASTNMSVGAALPTPDFTGDSDLSATNGKVALARITTSLACGAATDLCPQTNIVDLVGYGSATDFEGSAATPVLSATKSAARKGNGCTNTESNVADFDVGAPAPRNSSTALHVCDGADAASDAGPVSGGDASSSGDGGASDAGTPEGDDAAASEAGTPDGDDAAASDAGTSGATDAGTLDDGSVSDGSDDGGPPCAGLVISQVFGGGGNSGAPYASDFVELFNRSGGACSLAGLSLQYGSKAEVFAPPLSDGGPGPNLLVLPAATLAPGQYFLVGLNSNSATGAALPAVDAEGTLSLSATDGKVAVASITTSLGCGTATAPCPLTNIVNMVGYGAAADFEGAGPAGALSNAKAALRLANGCVDTHDNAADFEVGTPMPRNSEAPALICAAQYFDAGTGGGDDAGSGFGTNDAGSGFGTGDAGAGAVDAGGQPVDDDDAGVTAGEEDSGAGVDTEDSGVPNDGTAGGFTTGGNNGACSCGAAGAQRGGVDGLAGLGSIAILGGALSTRRRARPASRRGSARG